MDVAAAIRLGITVSMLLLMFALGLRAGTGYALYLFRRPKLLLRSILAMNIAMPLFAIVLVVALNLHPAVKVALVALAVSPVPPFLPGKQLKLATNNAYTYGLLVAASLLAIVLVPLTMALIAAGLDIETRVTAAQVLKIVATTILIPLGLGMMTHRLWPAAERFSGPLNVIGAALLLVVIIPLLIAQWPQMRSLIGNGTLLAIVIFTAAGLLIGHLCGGPDADDRSVLALATASRHPAVALTIANAGFPEQTLTPAAIVLALIVGIAAAAPYTAWRKRLHIRPASVIK